MLYGVDGNDYDDDEVYDGDDDEVDDGDDFEDNVQDKHSSIKRSLTVTHY